jgi:hypothetical protein
VDFMGELGQTFNKESPQTIKAEDMQRLNSTLDALLDQI